MPLASTFAAASTQARGHVGRGGGQRRFAYTGSLQTFAVPLNIGQLYIDMAGAAGGGSSNSPNTGGGRGGHRVTCVLPVTPGATLHIAVGGAGYGAYVEYSNMGVVFSFPGGWPGGGDAGTGSLPYMNARSGAGSGGGYSGIFVSSSMTQANARVIAAGGGGRANVQGPASYNGGNATTTAGGAKGGPQVNPPGNWAYAGSALQGGHSDYYAYEGGYPAGGGGGGYFGGGGGYGDDSYQGGSGSGGDGSSWGHSSVLNFVNYANVQAVNGYVQVTW